VCGRYTLTSPGEAIAEALEMAEPPPRFGGPRYNVAPTQPMPIVRATATGGREWALATWGFDGHLINARAETLNRQPAFRSSFRARRCLVPADGFFEWMKDGRHRQAFYFHRRDRRPFAFAGLWEEDTFTVVTCPPNELVAQLHDRMPVILAAERQQLWLGARKTIALEPLLVPARAADWESYPVGRAVHSPAHDAPDCIAPVAAVATPPRQVTLFG
jgi:putative SOS response-associated peptidase YedK